MKKFMGFIRFVYIVWAVIWFCMKGCFKKDKATYYRPRIGPAGLAIIKRLNVKLDISGLEELDPAKTYILMGNHRSYTDILIIFLAMAASKRDVSFMSKKEIFKVPFLGGAMKALNVIGVERGESSEAFKSLIRAVQALKNGENLVVFPEGTRSVDGNLLPLKRGGFIMAVRAGMDIAPFVIHGSEKFMPKSGFFVYPADVSIKMLPTISVKGRKDKELMEIVDKSLRDAI